MIYYWSVLFKRNPMVRLPRTHPLEIRCFTVRMCSMTDSIDRRLIQLLWENAHKSSRVLAKQLSVSSSTIRRRIKTLLQFNPSSVAGDQLTTQATAAFGAAEYNEPKDNLTILFKLTTRAGR